MKVTVIIPNYNGKHFMEPCMEALANQTYTDFEILVIDNASSDGSAEFIRERYREARLLVMEKNLGFSGAVNVGIRASDTPYVLLLNNDTRVRRHFVEAMVKTIERSEKIFSVSSKMIQMYHPDYIDDAGDQYCLIGWGFQRGISHPATQYTRFCQVFSACAGAAIYRREVFEEIGYFDEMYFAYLEDMDIGYRARIAGYRNLYCPTAVVEHVGSGTSGSKYNAFKVRLAARNSVYLNYKNMPAAQMVLNALPLAFGWFLKYRFFVKRGFGDEFRAGLREGIKTRKKCKKVPYRRQDFWNYVRIEWDLVKNMFLYAWEYTHRTQPK
ncbi:MAG: glycosyltransferase family 2 protein [Lachnospiraceae bacterium]|nr:glycosyltransferase family 2 protein [Lachnospiraceae bacterium]